MLCLTLDNLKTDDGKGKTYAKITTPSGEIINIYFLDNRRNHPQARIGIDAKKSIDIQRAETDANGEIAKVGK